MKKYSEITKNIFVVSVGPLALVPALLLLSLGNMLLQGSQADWQGAILSSLFVSLIGLFIAYPLTFIIGIPAVLILRRYQLLGFFPLAICGLLGSLLVTLWISPSLQTFLLFSYCSSAVVCGCWFAYKYVKL